MLELRQTHLGIPPSSLNYLVIRNDTLILYPSADAVVILNAHTLDLVRVLTFSEAFPGTSQPGDRISCFSVDAGMKLVVASMGTRVAAWSLSTSNTGSQGDVWRIHSSLVLPTDHAVTALDCNAGLLAVGSRRGLSVYTLILENDLPTWSQKWMHTVTTPSIARFCPSMEYIATTSMEDYTVRIFSTTTGRLTQNMPHPRPIVSFTWRHSEAASRDDLVLYTTTSDSVLRIFILVVDSQQYLQLHGVIDVPFVTTSCLEGKSKFTTNAPPTTNIFWLDRKTITESLKAILQEPTNGSEDNISLRKRAQEVIEEGWDIFLRVMKDGSVIVTAVAYIDGRPPRFLKQFTLQHTLPGVLSCPMQLRLLPQVTKPNLPTMLITSALGLTSYAIDPLHLLFDMSDGNGMGVRARGSDCSCYDENGVRDDGMLLNRIVGFVRTPEGRGVGVIREGGGGGAWVVDKRGTGMRRSGFWKEGDLVVMLEGGKNIATYSSSSCMLTLHSSPPVTLSLPAIMSLISLPYSSGSLQHESIIAVAHDFSIVHVVYTPASVSSANIPTLTQHSHHALPLPKDEASRARVIIPVDPMAWSIDKGEDWGVHDVLLSVSASGELAFWILDEATVESAVSEQNGQIGVGSEWRCTGKVRTGRQGFSLVSCSSAKKSALVVPGPDGEELTIWDSKESEFASGMEYRTVFSSFEPINDLDWTSTPDNQSILAVGFPHHIQLLCQQRMTYFDEVPGWAMCWKIEISHMVPYPISDSIWLANGSLLVGAGHQMFLFGQPLQNSSTYMRSDSLFEYAARHNGPLRAYHPQMLLQCLLWEKVEVVKEIIVNLARDLEKTHASDMESTWRSVPVERFLQKDGLMRNKDSQSKQRYHSLFSTAPVDDGSKDRFSRELVEKLVDRLEGEPLPYLTPNEHAHLLVLIQTTLEIDEQRRSLDANGLRYMISLRSFYILNHRLKSHPGSPQTNGTVPRYTGYRDRLRYRDMIWAFHSESQDLLLTISTTACNGKMCWQDARALGVFVWLNSLDSLKTHMEFIARNEYMAGDNRDPTACSLFYFAIGKVKLVHGLWRQAAWHKEQTVMLKFLGNDFNEPRWRTAALKNAYALLSKRRFEYAAAFFLLGNSLKDAVNVCIRQLDDFQLAVALARIVEQGDEGPILRSILEGTVLPSALKDGNRWLGSWAFWMLRRRDVAVRILLTPLQDITSSLSIQVTDIGEPHYDDPSLALLFSQLKAKTLQAAKGTSEISGRAEFNFVLQIARVFCRMGCHVLALDLVKSWSFERPSTIARDLPEASNASVVGEYKTRGPPSPTSSRRPMFPLEPALRRRSSILIDMDIPSEPPTRRASPERAGSLGTVKESIKEEADLLARKAGMGNLMKTAKQDVQVPEFDMGAFF